MVMASLMRGLVLLQSQQEPRKVLLYISDIKEATNHQLAWRRTRVVFDVVLSSLFTEILEA